MLQNNSYQRHGRFLYISKTGHMKVLRKCKEEFKNQIYKTNQISVLFWSKYITETMCSNFTITAYQQCAHYCVNPLSLGEQPLWFKSDNISFATTAQSNQKPNKTCLGVTSNRVSVQSASGQAISARNKTLCIFSSSQLKCLQ